MGTGVFVETIAATRILTIARPDARNALTRPVLEELARELNAAGADVDVRCVVLTGAGEHFCAGADLRQSFAEDPNLMEHLDVYMDAFHGLVRGVVRCSKPTIAMMDGTA